MAYRVIVNCPDAKDIVNLLKQQHGADYSKVWRTHDLTIGVFSFEWTGIYGGYTNLITLEHSKTSERCEVTIVYGGGGMPSLDSFLGSDNPLKQAINSLTSLANERGWEINVETAQIKSRGSHCPNCNSVYVYSKDKIREDGSVVCQNCGKSFVMQENGDY